MAIPKICIKCLVRPCCSDPCEDAKSAWLKENGVSYNLLHDYFDGEQMWLTNTNSEIPWTQAFRLPKEEIEEMKMVGETYTTGKALEVMQEFIIEEETERIEDEAAGVIKKGKRRKYGSIETYVRAEIQKYGGINKWVKKIDKEKREMRIWEQEMLKRNMEKDIDELRKKVENCEQEIRKWRMINETVEDADKELKGLELWEMKIEEWD